MKRTYCSIFLLLALVFLSGFGERQKADPLDLTTNKASYSKGEPVKLSIKFTNISSEAISTYFTSGQKFDIIIMDGNKKEIWRWSHGKMFTMAIQPFGLEQGESVSYSYSWDQKDNSRRSVAPGKYYVTGVITIVPRITSKEKVIMVK